MGLQAHESRPENKVALATGLSIMVWLGAPSFVFFIEGRVPINLDHRIASTILPSGRRRGRPRFRFWGRETTTLPLSHAQDYAPAAHNEYSETPERGRRMSRSCHRIPRFDHRDLLGLRLSLVTI
jgi:hypothetical protein